MWWNLATISFYCFYARFRFTQCIKSRSTSTVLGISDTFCITRTVLVRYCMQVRTRKKPIRGKTTSRTKVVIRIIRGCNHAGFWMPSCDGVWTCGRFGFHMFTLSSCLSQVPEMQKNCLTDSYRGMLAAVPPFALRGLRLRGPQQHLPHQAGLPKPADSSRNGPGCPFGMACKPPS